MPAGPATPLPWENRAQLGTIQALIKTAERVLKPNDYFDAVALSDDPAPAVKFGVTCWIVGATARALLGFVFGGLLEIPFFGGHYVSFTGDVIWLVWELGVAAVMGFLAVHLFATIEHSILESQKGATRTKNATLRVAGYAGVAGLLFMIPGHLGNLVWIATILLNMVGLQRVHRADQNKALISALVASVAIGFLYAVVLTLIVASIFVAIFATVL